MLCESCGCPELPRRDADKALEVTGEHTLVREASVHGDLRQGQVAAPLRELLGPLDAAHDDVLVRRQPGGRLELPREVVGSAAGSAKWRRSCTTSTTCSTPSASTPSLPTTSPG